MAADSSDWIRVGVRVTIKDKGFTGTVKFFGSTEFAPGKWVGVELDEPQGKNNGVVKGKSYFESRDQHGLFVRTSQIEALPTQSSSFPPTTPPSAHKPSGLRKPQGVTGGGVRKVVSSPGLKRSSGSKTIVKSSPDKTETTPSDTPSDKPLDTEEVLKPIPSYAPPSSSDSSTYSQDVTDLQQRLAVLQHKRSEDRNKIKELEKYRLQFQQMVEYKNRWAESQTELKQQLKAAEKEARDAVLARDQIDEEMRDLSDTVEIATLDKEMAEEKCETLQAENEALKERIEELTMDLEILQNEISESGYEGAAASGQLKQLENQNQRLKEALVKLRDVSNQEKTEHQRVVKDLERQTAILTTLKDEKERIEEELKASDDLLATLKEQVDVAMGAEEMVEKLTDTNLQLEEEIATLKETVNDLEAIRDLTEEQEELRLQEEHELREEVDMNMNTIRQMERRVEASQETIMDQLQTIEKFRELVRHLQSEISELRKTPSESGAAEDSAPPIPAQDSVMLNQLKSSAIKSYSRTIDYELRKLEAIQAADTINHFKSFLPNSFLVSGGDYDSLRVVMLLPRIVFKSELIIDQLKQQTNLEECFLSLSTLTSSSNTDLLTYVAFLIYKLTTLQQLAKDAIRVLAECDVQMYRQVGGVRDDLAIHEKALDIFIELLKKEQLVESVPLNGIEKAINHFESLLKTRLCHDCQVGHTEHLLGQMSILTAGSDYCTLELIRLKHLSPASAGFVTQLKEMDTLNNDVKQYCRKIRRRVPTSQSGKIVSVPPVLIPGLIARQQSLVTCYRAFYNKVHQKSQGLGEGETLSNAELEASLEEVAKLVLQDLIASLNAKPEDVVHICLMKMSKQFDNFLNELQEGIYDTKDPKIKVVSPLVTRAQIVKGELSDTEGLKYKLEEKGTEIMELKKALKMKGQEIGEVNVKADLLQKRLEIADAECSRKVEEEKMETERIKTVMTQQEAKFNKAIQMLQQDMETLETERDNLKKQMDTQSRTAIPGDIAGTRRSMSLSGSKALVALLAKSPSTTPRHSATSGGPGSSKSVPDVTTETPVYDTSPLLLAHVDSLRKALHFSVDENIRLKAEVTKNKMAALPPLIVPRRSPGKSPKATTKSVKGKNENRSDTELSIATRSSNLLQELNDSIARSCVVDITKQGKGVGKPKERLVEQLSSIIALKQRANELKQEAELYLASSYPGGVVRSQVKPFVSTQFNKVLNESSNPSLLAKLRIPAMPTSSESKQHQTKKVFVSANQFHALHLAVVS